MTSQLQMYFKSAIMGPSRIETSTSLVMVTVGYRRRMNVVYLVVEGEQFCVASV